MKKIIYIVLLLLFFANKSDAENNIMFEKANQLYHNKMYDSASSLYLQMIDEGYSHPDLFYNAGNSFYKSNKTGMAVWCYKKAMQHTTNKNYRDNLTLAEKKIIDPFPYQKEVLFIRWWKGIYNLFSVNIWAIISLISFLIAMVILFIKKIKKDIKISKRVSLGLIILSFFSMLFMAVKYYNDTFHYHGIIIKNSKFKVSDLDINPINLSEGIEVEYAGIGKTGMNIILPNGQKGIIDGSAFKKL